ncbi:hypothetical protein KSS87_011430, partial [Heliosperma pusillum]
LATTFPGFNGLPQVGGNPLGVGGFPSFGGGVLNGLTKPGANGLGRGFGNNKDGLVSKGLEIGGLLGAGRNIGNKFPGAGGVLGSIGSGIKGI